MIRHVQGHNVLEGTCLKRMTLFKLKYVVVDVAIPSLRDRVPSADKLDPVFLM